MAVSYSFPFLDLRVSHFWALKNALKTDFRDVTGGLTDGANVVLEDGWNCTFCESASKPPSLILLTERYFISVLFVAYSMTPSKGFIVPSFNDVHMLTVTVN